MSLVHDVAGDTLSELVAHTEVVGDELMIFEKQPTGDDHEEANDKPCDSKFVFHVDHYTAT